MKDLSAYHELFKSIVLKHVHNVLDPSEWSRLRNFANNLSRYPDRNAVANLSASPEELLKEALSEDGLTVDETLQPFNNWEKIGEIEAQPVFYIQEEGVYVWGKEPSSQPVLSFWATYPAYPPSW